MTKKEAAPEKQQIPSLRYGMEMQKAVGWKYERAAECYLAVYF
jgi:hypothetical protein